MNRTLDELLDAVASRSVAVILGAGISVPVGIPTGYKLPVAFGLDRPDLVARLGLEHALARCDGSDRPAELAFTNLLTSAFAHDQELQESFLLWLSKYAGMEGVAHDDHATFVLLWLKGVFRQLITTNWDFMLESQIDAIYEVAYDDPMGPAEIRLMDATAVIIEPNRLFHAVKLDEEDVDWRPRYDIVASQMDIAELDRGAKPIWKIHGSPFFLACPECRGINRWHRLKELHVGDPCPTHPSQRLRPEIVFWGAGIDHSSPAVWRAVQSRMRRCELVLAIGFSGSDEYIRKEVEAHPFPWVINPSPDEWNLRTVNYVASKATPLATALRKRFL